MVLLQATGKDARKEDKEAMGLAATAAEALCVAMEAAQKAAEPQNNRYSVLCMSHISSASLLRLPHPRPAHVLLLPSGYLSLMHCSIMSLAMHRLPCHCRFIQHLVSSAGC